MFRNLLLKALMLATVLAAPSAAIGQSNRFEFILTSNSMMPTFLPAERLLILEFLGGSGPSRGEVIAFRLPRDNTSVWVSRIVGAAGDEIQMKNGVLFVNGQAVPKLPIGEYLSHKDGGALRIPQFEETLPNGKKFRVLDAVPKGPFDNTSVFKVPVGHYFVLGDNRDGSTDSRAQFGVGYIPSGNIIGAVVRP